MAHFENERGASYLTQPGCVKLPVQEKNSKRIIAKLDKLYPEFREYQEAVEERCHEVDIIPYVIFFTNGEDIYDMSCLETSGGVKEFIIEMLEGDGSCHTDHIFHNGKEIEFEINIALIEKK